MNRIGRMQVLWRRSGRSFSSVAGPSLVAERAGDGVLKLTLNRGAQRNALNMDLLKALEEQLSICKEDGCKEIRSVLIQANGPAFCSGHDLKEMMLPSNATEEKRRALFNLCSHVMTMVERVPQPVVAAVHGIATAAGCQLVAACDIAVSTSSCRFATPGVSIGLFCSTPAVSLVRAVGKKRAMDMLLTGRLVSAKEALGMGLVSRVVESRPTPEEEKHVVQETALEIAKDVASRSGSALAIGKTTFYRQSELDLEEAYRLASDAMTMNMAKVDAQEGIDAFLSKRKPEWKHE